MVSTKAGFAIAPQPNCQEIAQAESAQYLEQQAQQIAPDAIAQAFTDIRPGLRDVALQVAYNVEQAMQKIVEQQVIDWVL